MYAGALPGPTPYAGLPELYAARTRPMPPVARITATSRCFISSCVPSRVTVVIHPMDPAGAPALQAASDMISTERVMQRTAAGCGLTTIAQRALSAINTLYMAVDVGL